MDNGARIDELEWVLGPGAEAVQAGCSRSTIRTLVGRAGHPLPASFPSPHSAFGGSAMAEAVKCGHDRIIDVLLSYGGT